jgi:2-methylcitrate dehydratase PrpD
MSFVVERFASWAEAFRTQTIAPEVLHHARRVLIDTYAAMLSGAESAPAALLERAFADELDHGGARLALGRRATVHAAALINGAAAHTREMDDIFRDGIYHPGAPTVPAALAIAQARGASGEQLLRSVIVGYEVSTRIAAAMGRGHYEYWHNTGTVGTFGACAAAAEGLRLDAPRFAHALATAATFAAGLQQAFRSDSMSKPMHAGHAAEAGVTAALAAEAGVIGALDVIEGEAGFGRAMGDRQEGPDWERALESLGRVFNVTRMTVKNHTCCGHTFAAIDGAIALKARMGVAAEDIERVRVATYRAALEVAGCAEPHTPAEARFSLRYVVATALTHGNVRFAAFEPARIEDRGTRDLMRRIELAVDPELDATFPGQRAARVRITARDGRSEDFLQPTRVGDPEAPLTDRQLEEKYFEFARPVLGAERAQRLLEKLWRVEKETTLNLVDA